MSNTVRPNANQYWSRGQTYLISQRTNRQSFTHLNTFKTMRILITRLSHIGDCILTLPLVNAIRAAYPDAFIAWAVESPTQKLLEYHDAVDEIILIPKGWMKKPSAWKQLRQQLKSGSFDIAIDPQGLTKSAMLGRLSGAPRRIGIKGRWGRELSPWLNNELVTTQADHVVDRSLELLSRLDITSPQVKFGLPTTSEADRKIDQWLSSHQLNNFAVINPGASWRSKRWENDRFATVASHLYRQQNLRTVITWAGDEEKQMAQEIFALNQKGSVLALPTSLNDYASLVSRSQFFIGCDTGPMHIATAVGTPCVGLYGTTLPQESGAYGPSNQHVQKWHQSGSCKKRRKADNFAMRDIMASDVNAACDQMIATLGQSKAA